MCSTVNRFKKKLKSILWSVSRELVKHGKDIKITRQTERPCFTDQAVHEQNVKHSCVLCVKNNVRNPSLPILCGLAVMLLVTAVLRKQIQTCIINTGEQNKKDKTKHTQKKSKLFNTVTHP